MTRHYEDEGTILLVSAFFSVRFTWIDDRWTHAIEYHHLNDLGQRSTVTIAQAVEGLEFPAFQQIHVQEIDNAIVALLVGLSGTHHYSASCRLFESQDATSASIEWDIADRCARPEHRLAATYQTPHDSPLSPKALIESNNQSSTWQVGNQRLSLHTLDSSQMAIAEAGRRGWFIQALSDHQPGSSSTSSTRRCRFTWSVV